ncbi:MAG: single-stranded DNA-binding protein [Proteobacteria bacterium]|nr:single-stranded DNA-binding protein [Pseudomonadota bacterium]
MGFNDLKKKSKTAFEKLTTEVTKMVNKSESYKDDRFWRPEQDKAGNGYAVIRFLSAPEGEDMPWARLFSHGFKGPGGWYIENSRTTLGEKDPVSEMNTQLWNSGVESDKDIARNRKRRLNYISNIMIVSDPANPQNEGKVFLYKYGKKIFDKIQEAMQPEFDDETPINPFDFWSGANFKLKVRKIAGFVNYDKSEFESTSELFQGEDDKKEEIWKTQYSLTKFTDATNFKSYDELKERLFSVVGENIRSTAGTETRAEDTVIDNSESNSDESGDALSYFEKLANE